MIDIVIPTIGRDSLRDLLSSLAASSGPLPTAIFIVDDRRACDVSLDLGDLPPHFTARIRIIRGRAAGPAAARNCGWRAAHAEWIAFLDDDVRVDRDWLSDLAADVSELMPGVAGSQGRIRVPLPIGRNPTDWERNVAGLAGAHWITADCAYRRSALATVDGFDERFPRAFREDADLGLRILAQGWRIEWGSRTSVHPVRPSNPWISVTLQAGNADDVLMEALHGRDWYERAGASRGAFATHAAIVMCAFVALLGAATWLLATLNFALRRIAPGPRSLAEIGTMAVTSVAIPFAAVAYRFAGYLRVQQLFLKDAHGNRPLPRAVLFDRDGTLIVDIPFNVDPDAVRPMPGGRSALARLRAAGIATGIITNQSGVALGAMSLADVDAVNARVNALLGPFDPIFVCIHGSDARCECRKPAPGLVLAAARHLGVNARECVLVGDIGSDMLAARAAGARAILVPTPVTQADEVAAAPEVADSLCDAIDRILECRG